MKNKQAFKAVVMVGAQEVFITGRALVGQADVPYMDSSMNFSAKSTKDVIEFLGEDPNAFLGAYKVLTYLFAVGPMLERLNEDSEFNDMKGIDYKQLMQMQMLCILGHLTQLGTTPDKVMAFFEE